jgi:hypothetical protein
MDPVVLVPLSGRDFAGLFIGVVVGKAVVWAARHGMIGHGWG